MAPSSGTSPRAICSGRACHHRFPACESVWIEFPRGIPSSRLRRVHSCGKCFMRVRADYEHYAGPPQADWTEPPALDNDMLWQVRRDLEGRVPNEPAKDRTPPNEPLLGLTILQLRAGGATSDGSYWLIGGRRVRVMRALNKALHRVEAEFEREVAPAIAPDLIIAVGAESQALAANVARAGTKPTIARGSAGKWFTRPDALQELHL